EVQAFWILEDPDGVVASSKDNSTGNSFDLSLESEPAADELNQGLGFAFVLLRPAGAPSLTGKLSEGQTRALGHAASGRDNAHFIAYKKSGANLSGKRPWVSTLPEGYSCITMVHSADGFQASDCTAFDVRVDSWDNIDWPD